MKKIIEIECQTCGKIFDGRNNAIFCPTCDYEGYNDCNDKKWADKYVDTHYAGCNDYSIEEVL